MKRDDTSLVKHMFSYYVLCCVQYVDFYPTGTQMELRIRSLNIVQDSTWLHWLYKHIIIMRR